MIPALWSYRHPGSLAAPKILLTLVTAWFALANAPAHAGIDEWTSEGRTVDL